MVITENKTKFQTAHDNLPYKDREAVLNEIMRRLHVSLSTVNNKRAGRSKIRAIEMPIIKSIYRQFGIDFETGETIK